MIGLVLQGGGAKGSYHVGAVEALIKRGVKFDVVVGTSIGAINGALISTNDIIMLKKIWEELDSKRVFNIEHDKTFSWDHFRNDLNNIKSFINNNGIDITTLKEILKNNVDENKIRESNIDFGLTTFNLTDKKPIEVFKKDIPKGKLIEYLLASAYLPIFKSEKIINNKYYIDGGIFNNCPFSMLDYDKFDKIYIIKVYKNEAVDKELKKEKVVLISPNQNLGSFINFDNKSTKFNIKLGYYDALRSIDNLDGKKYYIKYKNEDYYKKLFDKKIKDKILFELNIYKNINEKKLILKILESLSEYCKINRFKVYTVKALIILLKLKMIDKKEHKYYPFIKNIKII